MLQLRAESETLVPAAAAEAAAWAAPRAACKDGDGPPPWGALWPTGHGNTAPPQGQPAMNGTAVPQGQPAMNGMAAQQQQQPSTNGTAAQQSCASALDPLSHEPEAQRMDRNVAEVSQSDGQEWVSSDSDRAPDGDERVPEWDADGDHGDAVAVSVDQLRRLSGEGGVVRS